METTLFTYKGRITRTSYWTSFIIATLVQYIILKTTIKNPTFGVLGYPLFLISGYFLLIQGIKRMHDIGKSGWNFIIPLYGLILLLTEGDSGTNKYGSSPKEIGSNETGLSEIIMTVLLCSFIICILFAILVLTKLI